MPFRLGLSLKITDIRRLGGAAPFSPTDVPNLIGWWDVSDATKVTKDVSDLISQIDDKSGEGNHLANAIGSTQPLWVSAAQNGLDVARFNGTDELISRATFTGGALTPPYTVFTGMKFISLVATTQIFVSSLSVFSYLGGTNWNYYNGAVKNTGVAVDTNWHYLEMIYNSPSSEFHRDGTKLSGPDLTGTNSHNGMTIGARTGPLQWANADIGEVLIYDGIPSAGDTALLETYLARWI